MEKNEQNIEIPKKLCYNYSKGQKLFILLKPERRKALISYADDVKIISSFHKTSKPYGKIESRLTHGFIFRQQGCAEYYFKDKTVKVNEKEFIFLPKGTAYEYRVLGGENAIYTSINFLASFEKAEIAVYPFENFYAANYITQSFSELFKFGTDSDKLKCQSILYDLLSYVLKLDSLKDADDKKPDMIEPAIEYLKKHIYDSSFKLEKLHSLCGISDTYFRKIFISRFGLTPQEYVQRERITHAKSIIEGGDFDNIREVANSVGYNDPLYFSKAFKKFYGFPPSRFNE